MSASYADMASFADATDNVAGVAAEAAAAGHVVLFDDDLALSAVVDPVGAAEAVAQLGVALDGPSGLTALALRIGARAVYLRAAVWK